MYYKDLILFFGGLLRLIRLFGGPFFIPIELLHPGYVPNSISVRDWLLYFGSSHSVSVSVSFISAPPQEKQKEINKHIEL